MIYGKTYTVVRSSVETWARTADIFRCRGDELVCIVTRGGNLVTTNPPAWSTVECVIVWVLGIVGYSRNVVGIERA